MGNINLQSYYRTNVYMKPCVQFEKSVQSISILLHNARNSTVLINIILLSVTDN